MPVQTLLQKLSFRKKQQEERHATSYQDLVASLANGGEEPAADAAGQILDAAGKSPDDLKSDVELVLRRRELTKLIAAGDGLGAELQRLERERMRAKEAWHVAYRKLNAEDEVRRERIHHIMAQQRTIERYRAELARISPSSNLRGQIDRDSGAIQLRRSIGEGERKLKECRSRLARLEGQNRGIELRTPDFTRVEAEIVAVRREIAQLEGQLSAARAKESSIRTLAESAEKSAVEAELAKA